MVNLSKTLSSFIVFCIVVILNSIDVFSQWNDKGDDIHNTNSGNVGIGTTNPSGKLHIYGDSIEKITLQTTQDSANYHNQIAFRTPGAIKYIIGTSRNATDTYFVVSTAEDLALSVNREGNVGIGGINTSSCELAVQGTIGAREVIVTTDTFPDYVFSKEYKLTPLDQVEDYILENQHLPGIPPSDEVKKNGISVGKMQVKLLEKIEELTLHMIALEKRNKMLEARIKEMGKR